MSQGELRSRFSHRVPNRIIEEEELRARLAHSDGVRLLLAAVHVTGDLSLLDRYSDKVGPFRVDDYFAAYQKLRVTGANPEPLPRPEESPQARKELTDLLCSVLASEDQAPYMPCDDPALFARMAQLVAPVHVDEAYVPMCMEQSGFVPDARAIMPTKRPEEINVAIIGAGMTGIDAAVKAIDRGFTFDLFDKEAGIGGLWWSQTYPGVAVDTPSMQYSLSWDLSPKWSRAYPVGTEYRAYLTELAEKYRVADRTHFNSEITKMEWVAEDQVWELTILDTVDHSTRKHRAHIVITAAGHLCRPSYPDVNGRESFAGESIHTARWRDVDLAGKRVGVIGVGAAGIQVIAELAGQVGHLTVFQRQSHWVLPNFIGEGKVDDDERWLREHIPYYLHWSRFAIFWRSAGPSSYALNKLDEEWMKTHPGSISEANELPRLMCLEYINETFGEGSELARKLTPDYIFGGKRPIRDPGSLEPGGYYYAFLQPHVDLVTSAVSRVVPEGIVDADGDLHELDVIIWATGMTLDWLSPIEIVGRDGVRLGDVWADNNPRSYLGGTVPGFPNLFVNDGPNTGVATGGGGHNFMTETVNHYIFECLQLMVENDARSLEVTQEEHDAHNERIEERMRGLIWSYDHKAHTYYRNEAGRIILPNPFTAAEYWTMSQRPEVASFILREKPEIPI